MQLSTFLSGKYRRIFVLVVIIILVMLSVVFNFGITESVSTLIIYSARLLKPSPATTNEKCSNHQRLHYIKKVCAMNNWTEDFTRHSFKSPILFNHFLKISYCTVAKSGTGTMMSIINQLSQYDQNATMAHRAAKLSDKDLRYALQEYTNLLVVRHPLSRLRSAYNGKLKVPGHLAQLALGHNIKFIDEYFQMSGRNRNESFDPLKETLTFEEFLEIIGTRYKDGFRDHHWVTIDELCKPCAVPYDVIIRLESFDEDMTIFQDNIDKFHTNIDLDVLHVHDKYKGIGLAEKEELISDVLANISEETVEKVMEVYEKDMKMLGYHWTQNEGIYCSVPFPVNRICC